MADEFNTKQRLFLVAGPDYNRRRTAVDDIKKKISVTPQALNTFTFYGKDTELEDFRKRLLTLSFGQSGIVLIKEPLSLPAPVKEFITNNLTRILAANFLICDSSIDLSARSGRKPDKFWETLAAKASLIRVDSAVGPDHLEAFKLSLRRNDFGRAALAAERMFETDTSSRDPGPLLIGILNAQCLWLADQSLRRRWLRYIWKADRQMKEKGLSSRLVMARLLGQLFSLV